MHSGNPVTENINEAVLLMLQVFWCSCIVATLLCLKEAAWPLHMTNRWTLAVLLP